MDFGMVVRRSCIKMHLESSDKEGIITELVDLLVDGGRITNREAALTAILERENKMSTGMQDGVAIPHGKTDSVPELVTAVALKKEGVDFQSLDGEPSRIFIVTLSSAVRTGPHIEYLAQISRVLSRRAVRRALLEAETREDVIRILSE
jgi:PTS system nitrogen regulatory IIA component